MSQTDTRPTAVPTVCSNCYVALNGQYCFSCGQRVDPHPPTIGHFAEEVVETVTHADSRLWKTLRMLLLQPGILTVDFFAGRRARYLPPIRLYFILSVAFFLVLALGPSKTETKLDLQVESVGCQELIYQGPFVSTVQPMLRAACARVVQDLQAGGAGFTRNFLANLPKAMFVLLPIFGGLMLAFYWRPRHLYAEHLIFLIHNHSAAFLALTILSLIDLGLPESLQGWSLLPFSGWLTWYCYRGLRVYYRQSRLRTLAKLVTMGMLYLFLASLILLFAGITAALSV
jgi:hypothetical protein